MYGPALITIGNIIIKDGASDPNPKWCDWKTRRAGVAVKCQRRPLAQCFRNFSTPTCNSHQTGVAQKHV